MEKMDRTKTGNGKRETGNVKVESEKGKMAKLKTKTQFEP